MSNTIRHGTRAGRRAGCDRPCCILGARRERKRARVRLQLHGPQFVDATPLLERLAWWDERGVGGTALADAAGVARTTISELKAGRHSTCHKDTVRAIVSLQWRDLADTSLCYADLTHRRLYSMMASGHRLDWIVAQLADDGLALSQRWRDQQRVPIATARAVAALAARVPAVGSAQQTATKARSKGHLPLMGWDDPGVPAMPRAWVPEGVTVGRRRGLQRSAVDHATVQRFLDGDTTVPTSRFDKEEIARRWIESGRSLADLGRLTGWKTDRYATLSDQVA